MKVIAGKAKGRCLYAPDGFNTRPITSKIKGALFNIWQAQIENASFLDLFAGSGSIGIEAISRGARNVVFVEKDKKAIDIIKKNLATCNFVAGYQIFQDDVFRRIELLKQAKYKFDIIYLDPPFTVDSIFLPVMEMLSDKCIVSDDGMIAIRTKKEKEMPDTIGILQKVKLKTYGISSIHFYCVNRASQQC